MCSSTAFSPVLIFQLLQPKGFSELSYNFFSPCTDPQGSVSPQPPSLMGQLPTAVRKKLQQSVQLQYMKHLNIVSIIKAWNRPWGIVIPVSFQGKVGMRCSSEPPPGWKTAQMFTPSSSENPALAEAQTRVWLLVWITTLCFSISPQLKGSCVISLCSPPGHQLLKMWASPTLNLKLFSSSAAGFAATPWT